MAKMSLGDAVDLWGWQRALFIRVKPCLAAFCDLRHPLPEGSKGRQDLSSDTQLGGARNEPLLWAPEKLQRDCGEWRDGQCAGERGCTGGE